MDVDASAPAAAGSAAVRGGAGAAPAAAAAAAMPPSSAAAAVAAAAGRAGSDDAMAGVARGRVWMRAASMAAAAARGGGGGGGGGGSGIMTAVTAAAAAPLMPLPAKAKLDWHNGADFFAAYALTRRRVNGKTDELDMYGQGGYGMVLGCELIGMADPPPPPLVVKRIKVDAAKLRVAAGGTLFEREVKMPMRAAALLDEAGLSHLLLYIIEGFMSTDPLTGDVIIYVVMERMPGAVPKPLLVPTGAVEPRATGTGDSLDKEMSGSGVDLCDHIPLSPFAARMVMKQMLEVEAALHARSIVHRDIKPDNVLVAGWVGEGVQLYPRIKLADFSVMRLIEEGDPLTADIGTRSYQPPEQLRPHPVSKVLDYDGGVDVFATGMVWYVAATGHPPRTDDDVRATGRFHEDATRGDTGEEALRYFRCRFPEAVAPGSPFSNPDGSLNDDGTLLLGMTRRWARQRLTAVQCLEHLTTESDL